MTTDEKLDRLTGIVESLAASAVAHDNQIEAHSKQIGALIDLATKQQKQIDKTFKSITALERQWQAYINTLPRN
ncbi:MAG: hypothetical protein ABSH49_04135 [Bryobacteraceae bacterium]|jgi:ABC-type transporter Mla subunit MlaD